MIQIKKLNTEDPNFKDQLSQLIFFEAEDNIQIEKTVTEILSDVKKRGDEAVIEASGKSVRKGLDVGIRYQINNWLFRPLEQLALDKKVSFENGYSIFGLELLFFEPHGKYLSGNSIRTSGECFRYGFNKFLMFL